MGPAGDARSVRRVGGGGNVLRRVPVMGELLDIVDEAIELPQRASKVDRSIACPIRCWSACSHVPGSNCRARSAGRNRRLLSMCLERAMGSSTGNGQKGTFDGPTTPRACKLPAAFR